MLEKFLSLFVKQDRSNGDDEPSHRSLSSGDIVSESSDGTRVVNHGLGKKDETKGEQRDRHCRKESREKRRRRLRKDAQYLLEESEHVKSIARDLQTYVQPIGYEVKTEDPIKNGRIASFVRDWMAKCDFYRQHTFFELLGMAEIGKTFDGYHGIAVVSLTGSEDSDAEAVPDLDMDDEDRAFLQLQTFDPERIGNPDEKLSSKDEKYYPKDFPKEKRSPQYYYEGIEFDKYGRPIAVHVWSKEAKDPEKTEILIPTIAQVAGETSAKDMLEWTYAGSFTWNQFILFSDPLKTGDILPNTDFEPAIKKLLAAIDILIGACDKADFASRLLGIMHGGDGHLDVNDLGGGGGGACDCGKEECPSCNPQLLNLGGRKIIGMPEGKDFKPSQFTVDADTFHITMEMLVSSAAISVHLPPSFTGISSGGSVRGRVQGTDVRVKLENAMAEINRRRDIQKSRALRIVKAAILYGKEQKDPRLADVEVDDIMDGEFLYRRDPTADLQRQALQFRENIKAGLQTEEEIHGMLGRSTDMVRKTRKREIDQVLKDIKGTHNKHSGEFSLAFIASLFRAQSSGSVQDVVRDTDEDDEDEDGDNKPVPFPSAQ